MTIKSVGRPEQGESIDVKKDKAEEKVDLAMIVGLPDFDAAAKAILPAKTWAYYSAGGTDEYSLALNRYVLTSQNFFLWLIDLTAGVFLLPRAVFNQVLFRPRVMRDVTDVDLSTEFLGHKVSMPVAVAPAGMASLSHPDGEVLLSSGAGKTGIAQFVRSFSPLLLCVFSAKPLTLSSLSPADLDKRQQTARRDPRRSRLTRPALLHAALRRPQARQDGGAHEKD